ncbi:hypothetical protein SAY86_001857 [Trapa natans]|uniref:Uncharacterized protein n=1 Tax=Trapa natans TaxID=22666 RepID=A0AAN7LN49_TRANT|nr:hypothetical protein SAY86_001857 [Trapa natans]
MRRSINGGNVAGSRIGSRRGAPTRLSTALSHIIEADGKAKGKKRIGESEVNFIKISLTFLHIPITRGVGASVFSHGCRRPGQFRHQG